MADSGRGQRELVFCHSCRNEWYRDEHGLQCPQCESEFVEVIEQIHDPRAADEDDESDPPTPPMNTLHDPLHDHNPWGEEAPDPDEGDISHVEWNGPGGIHFSRTSYRSTSPGIAFGGRAPANDPFALLQSVTQMMAQTPGPRGGPDRRGVTARSDGPGFGSGQYRSRSGPGSAPTSPLQEGPSRQSLGGGGRNIHTTTTRLWPRDTNNAQPQGLPVDDLHGLLGNLLQGIGGGATFVSTNTAGQRNAQDPDAPLNPFNFLQQLFNPANASHGDAVYTQEALDRVISQLMEQHAGSSAPGPASASAIASLPKKKIEPSMLGSDGKAECSVCMDNVSVGDEVTVLPCSHWFHGDCVGAWLKEHDTCPHCRQGIMPKEGTMGSNQRGPRTPNQPPRNAQNHWASPSAMGSGSRGNPFRVPESPSSPGRSRIGSSSGSGSSSRPHSHRRRSTGGHPDGRRSTGGGSSGGGGSVNIGGGGITGWMGRHFGSGSRD